MSALPPGPRRPRAVQTVAWITRPGPVHAARAAPRPATCSRSGSAASRRGSCSRIPTPSARCSPATRRCSTRARPTSCCDRWSGTRRSCCSTGPQHMRQRKLMLPPFHGARMAGYHDLIAEIAREHIAAWPRGRSIPLAPRMQAITLDVVLRVIFGVDAESDRLDALRERLARDARPRAERRLDARDGERRPEAGRAQRHVRPLAAPRRLAAPRADRGAPRRSRRRRALAAARGPPRRRRRR